MSVHAVERKRGERFVVRNRDRDGVNRSRAFATREEAEQYQAAIDAAKAKRRARELMADQERF